MSLTIGSRTLVVLATVLLVQVTACSSGSGAPDATAGGIRLGFVISLSGANAPNAGPSTQGAKVAVAEINARAVHDGKQIELVRADDSGDPEIARQVCSRLVSVDRVVAIIGAEASAARAACSKAAAAASVPYYAVGRSDGKDCSGNTFYLGAVPAQGASALVQFFRTTLAYRSFYIVGSDATESRAMVSAAAHEVDVQGGSVVAVSLVSATAASIKATLDGIARSRPDVLVEALPAGDQAEFQRQLAADSRLARQPRASLDMGMGPASSSGAGVSGTYLVQDYLTTDASPANQAWLAAIGRSFGDGAVPSAVGAETYDAVKLVSAAIVKAGSLQGAAIAAATVAVSITGPRGSIEIKPTSRGHATLAMHVGRLQPNNAIEQLAVSGALDPTLAC